MTVNFEFSDGHIDVKKSFHFTDDSYLVAVTSQATQNGEPLPHALGWRGGFGDATAANALTNQHALFYDFGNSKLTVKQVKEAKDGPVSFAGQYSFAGLEDAYFAGVLMPEGRALVEMTEFADQIPDAGREDRPTSRRGSGAAKVPTPLRFSRAPKTTSCWPTSTPSWSS